MKTLLPVILASAGFILGGCHKPVVAEKQPDPKVEGDKITFPAGSPQLTSFSAEPVETHPAQMIHLPARLVWNDDATVRVFTPFAGRLRKPLVEVGQSVAKGAPLAEVESPDFGQAQAEGRKAESDLRLAERNLARLRELFEHGAAPRKDLESAEAEQARAVAERERTSARLAAYGGSQTTVDEVFVLSSPIPGVVVERNANPGQEVRADQMLANAPQFFAPLFTVSDPARLWILIDATEVDLPRLKPGQSLTINSRSYPNSSFTGRVEVIAGFLDPITRTAKVRGLVDNSGGLLRAEMFVTVELPASETAQATVPARSVFLKGENHYAYVEESPGQFVRREIHVGAEEGGKWVVLSGLTPGERVVTEGCLLLEQLRD